MRLTYKSTLLPRHEHTVLEFDSEDDDVDEFLKKCRNYNSNYPTGEFRIELLSATESGEWLSDEFAQYRRNDLIDLMQVLITAESEDWNSSQYVMAKVFLENNDADSTISRVKDEEYEYDYNSDEDEAFSDFAQKYHADDIDRNYHDYVNWEELGRDRSDGCIEFADGNTYVYRVF